MTGSAKTTPTSEEVRDKEILSPEEVAAVLGCGRTMAYSLIRSGAIPSFTIGRLRRVRRTDLDRFIEERVETGEVDR